MTKRKHTPYHDFWHPKVEGQIRDTMYHHPEWFNFTTHKQKETIVNSLAKRIVGEILAVSNMAMKRRSSDAQIATPSGDAISDAKMLVEEGSDDCTVSLPSNHETT